MEARRKKFGNMPKRLAISFSSGVFIGQPPKRNFLSYAMPHGLRKRTSSAVFLENPRYAMHAYLQRSRTAQENGLRPLTISCTSIHSTVKRFVKAELGGITEVIAPMIG